MVSETVQAFTRVRDLQLRPPRSDQSTRFRRVLVPGLVPVVDADHDTQIAASQHLAAPGPAKEMIVNRHHGNLARCTLALRQSTLLWAHLTIGVGLGEVEASRPGS